MSRTISDGVVLFGVVVWIGVVLLGIAEGI